MYVYAGGWGISSHQSKHRLTICTVVQPVNQPTSNPAHPTPESGSVRPKLGGTPRHRSRVAHQEHPAVCSATHTISYIGNTLEDAATCEGGTAGEAVVSATTRIQQVSVSRHWSQASLGEQQLNCTPVCCAQPVSLTEDCAALLFAWTQCERRLCLFELWMLVCSEIYVRKTA
ncbi:hypothetical protein LZ32DRAFT_43079 [Colletotrichum eremochloae]|nr:hypothetical protein LZ32DRAFT_43079 [Colletotrichum eremochloae]